MPLSTPVAFLIFNRPDLTEIVFEAIRQAKPKKLLVVADGPRFSEEAEKCEQARAVIDQVDWDCEVLTNFSEKNLGCRQRVASGLDWVFSQVEEAIVLEDDCLPTPSFFSFCQTLLEYYRHDQRVMQIGGTNLQFGQKRTDYSYYFSKYPCIWGWASWQRAWKYYDQDMKSWPEFKQARMIEFVCENPYEQKYWTSIFDQMFESAVDTWDFQWVYACWSQNGLVALPNSNLISNIGFRSDATHTQSETPLAQLPTNDMWQIRHPPFIVRHQEADNYIFDEIIGSQNLKKSDTLFANLLSKIRLRLSIFKKMELSL